MVPSNDNFLEGQGSPGPREPWLGKEQNPTGDASSGIAGDGAPVSSPGNKTEESRNGKRLNLLLHMVSPEALQKIPEELARKWVAFPLKVSDGYLQVAMADPSNIEALEALSARSELRIDPLPASVGDIIEATDVSYKGYDHIAGEVEQIDTGRVATRRPAVELSAGAPVARALNMLIEEAIKSRASDICIEPQASHVYIRYRIDGSLHEVMRMPLEVNAALISRIKILANMNIADSRRPQDGQFSTTLGTREIDVRVATADTVRGEMAVLRLLDKSVAVFPLSKLGFSPQALQEYEAIVQAPWGMVLVSGPTGSGKTTTLYATVNSLDRIARHIVTIEDPVEYRFEGINQIQVNTKADVTFANGLRSILRLSPDVILVGEIRDSATAAIATQSALTGHLVLSSTHANDAVGTIFRLLDFGVEPFMVCASLIGVISQRLLRRLCPYCARLARATVVEQMVYERETGQKRHEFIKSAGCKRCAGTGYLGRIGVFELLTMTDKVKQLLMSGASPAAVRGQAIADGMVPLAKAGMLHVQAGTTTPREVLRNVSSPEEVHQWISGHGGESADAGPDQ
jgi:general secretion pathway protein E